MVHTYIHTCIHTLIQNIITSTNLFRSPSLAAEEEDTPGRAPYIPNPNRQHTYVHTYIHTHTHTSVTQTIYPSVASPRDFLLRRNSDPWLWKTLLQRLHTRSGLRAHIHTYIHTYMHSNIHFYLCLTVSSSCREPYGIRLVASYIHYIDTPHMHTYICMVHTYIYHILGQWSQPSKAVRTEYGIPEAFDR